MSSLLERQQSVGGVLVAGSDVVPRTYQFCRPEILHFGDTRAEYLAATTGVAVFDVSDRRQIELSGRDCRSFLHNYCTNDIKRLPPGHGCEALITNVKGHILAHAFVFATDSSVWLEAGPGDDAPLVAHFERYLLNVDVQVRARTPQYGQVLLSGPGSSDLLARACPGTPPLDALRHAMGRYALGPLAIRRIDLLGTAGYLLSIDRSALVDLWASVVAEGARPCGAEVFHALRIAAGFPLYGLDLTEDNLAQEAARTERAISFTKGCYLGQEPISRIDAVGHINRQLCQVRIDTDGVPQPGAAIASAEGNQVGVVTSAARIPGASHSIALACLRTRDCQSETQLMLLDNGRPVSVVSGSWDG